jgi:hypothetical protein
MGQVIAFPAHPTPCPGRVADLGFAENVLLVAIRCWVEAYRGATIPSHAFAKGSRPPGLLMPRFSIDALVTIVARAVRRPVEVHCPGCPNVSDDEKRRLYAQASLRPASAIFQTRCCEQRCSRPRVRHSPSDRSKVSANCSPTHGFS